MAVPQSIYEALPLEKSPREIRLLQFHEYVNSRVTVSMIKASLDDPDLSYAALSYCWGEPVFDQDVTCNGEIVKVTAGLFAALRRIQHMPGVNPGRRDKALGEALWVDQLCINQPDNDERSNQLQIMQDIYGGSKTCYCYIGEEEEYTSLALSYAKSRVRNVSHSHVVRLALDENGDLDRHESGGDVQDLPTSAADDDDGARALLMLCERPYCKRACIVQEVVLSSKPLGICGQYIFPLPAIGDALLNRGGESPSQGHTIFDMMLLDVNSNGIARVSALESTKLSWELLRQHSAGSENLALFDLVSKFRSLKADDPRDKIYANLSLAADRGLHPPAQYELSVEELYCTSAEAFVVSGRGLDVIQRAGATMGTSQFSLPSWVPDWSVRGELPTFSLNGPYLNGYSVTQDSVTLGAFPGTIGVEARYICVLEEVFDH